VPSYIEYRSVRDGVARAKAAGGGVSRCSAPSTSLPKSITSAAIHGRDLVISRDGETPEISFAYEKRIPLTEHATLFIDYDGTTEPGRRGRPD
jgi:hypothetical protein